jgi:Arc/MetJ-type ribon-helix-helix transcriptional regulator
MEIRPTPDQEAFIRDAIEAGRIESAEDAAKEALALWKERERRRSEILAAVDIAQASTARGEGIEITRESMRARPGASCRRAARNAEVMAHRVAAEARAELDAIWYSSRKAEA